VDARPQNEQSAGSRKGDNIMHPLRNAYEFTDAFFDALKAKSAALGRPVKCSKGCFHCCKEPVLVDIEEARFIVDALASEERADLTYKVSIWWNDFCKRGLDKLAVDKPGYLLKYRSQNIYCPLLNKADGTCSVYNNRPYACREFLAIKHPINCEDDAKRAGQQFAQADIPTKQRLEATFISKSCDYAPKVLLQIDYLGIWLGHILLGKTERSARAQDAIIEFQDEPAPHEMPLP
jgi:Fe-S-cluster containining protein